MRAMTFIAFWLIGQLAMAKPVTPPTIEEIFNGLNRDTMHLIDEFYAPEAVFRDPIVK